MINIKYFNSSLLKLYNKSYNNITIYHIGYITKNYKYQINSISPLNLTVHEVDDFIEEKERRKYLNFALTDSNSEVLIKHTEIWSGIEDQTKKINGSKSGEYGKDYTKIKFNSDDDLLLNKQLKFINLTIIVRTVFEEDGKYYPQFS